MKDIRKQLDEAYSLAMNKYYTEALDLCNAVIHDHPSLPDGLRERANIHARMDDLDHAIADITAVIDQGSYEPVDYFKRGWWHLDSGNLAHAVADFTQALTMGEVHSFHSYDESVYFFRATALLGLGRYHEALSDCAHVRDDFLIYTRRGRTTKVDIVREATAKTACKGPP